jgi:hypothetical protein
MRDLHFLGMYSTLLGIAFAGIFLFGWASSVAQLFLLIVRAVLLVTFGDVIARVLSFLYATTLTALTMWHFFTSLTAEIVLVCKVTNLVMQSRWEGWPPVLSHDFLGRGRSGSFLPIHRPTSNPYHAASL